MNGHETGTAATSRGGASGHDRRPISPRAGRRGVGLVAAAAAVAAAVVLSSLWPTPYSLDDAWISFRYARNWIDTGAFTFNPGRPPVEGMTNLLWTALAAVWVRALPDVDPIHPARAVGAACHLGTVVLAAVLAARRAGALGSRPVVAAAVAGGLVALSGSLAFQAVSGLETSYWALLYLAVLERADASLGGARRAGWTCGALLGLLAATRPEGVLAGVVLVAGIGVGPGGPTRARAVAVPFAAVVALVEVYRLVHFGALVPNTYHAKPPDLASGLLYLATYAAFGLGLVGPVACVPALARDGFARRAGAVALALLVGTVATGGDWMPGFRRFALTSATAYVLAGVGVATAAGRWRAVAAAGAVAILGGHLAAAALGRDRDDAPSWIWASLALRANRTPGVSEVALADIGRFGWYFRGSVFDLAGLTDARIARLPGRHGHKAWDEDHFRARRPDLVFMLSAEPIARWPAGDPPVQPPERPLLESVRARGGYRACAIVDLGSPPAPDAAFAAERWSIYLAGEHLIVFCRDGLSLPSDVWGPPPAEDRVRRIHLSPPAPLPFREGGSKEAADVNR